MSFSPRERRALLCLARGLGALLAAGILSGCSSTGGVPAGAIGYFQAKVATPFFAYGPAQSFGADFTLPQGQRVLLVNKEPGYSRIKIETTQQFGYVATEDLAPAPPPPSPPKAQTARKSWFGRSSGRNTPRPTSSRRAGTPASGPVIQSGGLFGNDDLPPLPQGDPLQAGDKPH